MVIRKCRCDKATGYVRHISFVAREDVLRADESSMIIRLTVDAGLDALLVLEADVMLTRQLANPPVQFQ